MNYNISDMFEVHNTRRKPQQQRSIDKLNRILDAATLLMANPDGKKLTTSKIAKKANIAVGSVYQFFSNVEEIKKATLLRVLSQISVVYQRVVDATPKGTPVADVCDALIDATASFSLKYPVIVKVITASTINEEFFYVKKQLDKVQLEMFTQVAVNAQSDADPNEIRRWMTTLILLGDTMTFQVWTARDQNTKDQFVAEWKGLARYYVGFQNT